MFAVKVKKRDELISFLKKRDIATSVYWVPVPMHPLYRKYKSKVRLHLKFGKGIGYTSTFFSDIKLKEINFILKSLKRIR